MGRPRWKGLREREWNRKVPIWAPAYIFQPHIRNISRASFCKMKIIETNACVSFFGKNLLIKTSQVRDQVKRKPESDLLKLQWACRGEPGAKRVPKAEFGMRRDVVLDSLVDTEETLQQPFISTGWLQELDIYNTDLFAFHFYSIVRRMGVKEGRPASPKLHLLKIADTSSGFRIMEHDIKKWAPVGTALGYLHSTRGLISGLLFGPGEKPGSVQSSCGESKGAVFFRNRSQGSAAVSARTRRETPGSATLGTTRPLDMRYPLLYRNILL